MNYSSFQYKQAPKAVLEACDEIGIVKNPLTTDTNAEFTAKVICTTSMSAADVATTLEADRRARFSVNGKSGIDPSGAAVAATDDICLFFRNTTASRVEFVQDITDKDIANDDGDLLNIPASIHYGNDPTPI